MSYADDAPLEEFSAFFLSFRTKHHIIPEADWELSRSMPVEGILGIFTSRPINTKIIFKPRNKCFSASVHWNTPPVIIKIQTKGWFAFSERKSRWSTFINFYFFLLSSFLVRRDWKKCTNSNLTSSNWRNSGILYDTCLGKLIECINW